MGNTTLIATIVLGCKRSVPRLSRVGTGFVPLSIPVGGLLSSENSNDPRWLCTKSENLT
jgi:hypothetical protein